MFSLSCYLYPSVSSGSRRKTKCLVDPLGLPDNKESFSQGEYLTRELTTELTHLGCTFVRMKDGGYSISGFVLLLLLLLFMQTAFNLQSIFRLKTKWINRVKQAELFILATRGPFVHVGCPSFHIKVSLHVLCLLELTKSTKPWSLSLSFPENFRWQILSFKSLDSYNFHINSTD